MMTEYIPVLARRSEKWSRLLQENTKMDKNIKGGLATPPHWPLFYYRNLIFVTYTQYISLLCHWMLIIGSKEVCEERCSQRTPYSDLDGCQWSPAASADELWLLPLSPEGSPWPHAGGDNNHWSVSCFFISRCVNLLQSAKSFFLIWSQHLHGHVTFQTCTELSQTTFSFTTPPSLVYWRLYIMFYWHMDTITRMLDTVRYNTSTLTHYSPRYILHLLLIFA